MSVGLYHFRAQPNAGDMFTPALWERAGIARTMWRPLAQARAVGTGSLLDEVDQVEHDNVLVWTTGFMHTPAHKTDLSSANVVALRGRLTREACVLSAADADSVVLGDGGLLAPDLLHTRQRKRYALGIVPHYVDKASVGKLAVTRLPDVSYINIQASPAQVARKIDQCDHVVSSSLHGLVFADALGVPSARFTVPTSGNIGGDGFKYADYYSALGLPAPTPHSLYDHTSIVEMISWTRAGGTKNVAPTQHALRASLDRVRQHCAQPLI